MAEFEHLLRKAQDAKAGGRNAWNVMSTGEKLAVAMALNKPEWLEAMGYTMLEALARIGPEWMSLLPRVVDELEVTSYSDN